MDLVIILSLISSSVIIVESENDTSTSHCLPSLHCKNETCHDNKCTYGCKKGYFGRMCSLPCSSSCRNSSCLESGDDQGFCTEGCENGYWGNKCNKRCSSACEKCDRQDGSVCEECDGYHHGLTCEISCYETCPDTGCDRNGKCRPALHSSQCGHNCIDCDDESSSCKLCKAGYAGKSCVYCRNCNGKCDEACTEGCVTGYHGTTCLKLCSEYCSGGCFQSNGTCLEGCQSGYYGNNCENMCHENCAKNGCNRSSGKCSEGCKVGFFGPSCVFKCSNCLSGLCNQNNGNCTVRCVDGYFGETCNKKCDKTCAFNPCNRLSGICHKGIVAPDWSTLKPKNTTTSNTQEPSLFAIVGSIGILLLCCTIAGLLLFKFCKSPCFQRRQVFQPDEMFLKRSLPVPPAESPTTGYYVINEDEMDRSNQSVERRMDLQTPPSSKLVEDTNKISSLSTSGDCVNEETMHVLTSGGGDETESENLPNIQLSPEMIPLEVTSRNSLTECDLISKVENSVYRKGVISRESLTRGNTQLRIPKQYLTPVTDEESHF